MKTLRPCSCDRFRPGEPFDRRRDCRLCWLYHNDAKYRELWDRPAPEPKTETPKPAPLSPSSGRGGQKPCGGCGGDKPQRIERGKK